MCYTVTVARQVLRDAEEARFYQQSLGTYPEKIEKFCTHLEMLIYDTLADNPEIGSSLSSRLDTYTTVRYLPIDDYILFYDVQVEDQHVDVLRLLPAKSNWMTTIQKYL